MLGATGTIGRAVVKTLAGRGIAAIPVVRKPVEGFSDALVCADIAALAPPLAARQPEAVISCMASRTGAPDDAWAVDHDAQVLALEAALAAGAQHFVLLSAICVQRPRLAFQFAKLGFEERLRAAPIRHSIVRPTAYFKSLSGQVARVAAGKPFLVFGDGRLTATKPLSDADCAAYLVDCLTEAERFDATLPIGGPGPAITLRDQAKMLETLLGRPVAVRGVSPAILKAAAVGLSVPGRVIPALGRRASLAAIGHYYATQSMLVFDPASGRYEADQTPETGADRLIDHYRALLRGEAAVGLGDHAVF